MHPLFANARPLALFLAALLLALAGSGCQRPTAVERATAENILLKGNGPEPQALDPHVTTGTAELNIQFALFEGLLAPHPRTLQPQPAVARAWSVSDDQLIYTFQLDPAARWSDGQPVSAEDFRQAWLRALSPQQAAPYATQLFPIRGARAFNEGREGDPASVGVVAAAPQTLEVALEKPDPTFLLKLLHPVWFPIPAHIAAAAAGERVGPWTRPGSFVGNGPFVLSEWRPNQFIEVSRNPQFRAAGEVLLDGIRFYAIDEPAAQERAFLGQQLHLTDAVPPNRVRHYQQSDAARLRVDPYLGTYYILLNHRIAPLDDPRVRKALALALDRPAIAERLLGAGQRPAYGFVPDNLDGFASLVSERDDPAQARALLAEAGFPDGRGFPQLEFLFNTSESHRKIAEAMQDRWRSVLGIHVQLANVEWRTYLQRRSSGDFQLARAVWIGDYPDPATFLDLWESGNPQNWVGWHNAAYDEWLQIARSAPDAAARARAFAEAEALLIAEQAVIPLYFYVSAFLIRPEVHNWPANLLNWPQYLGVSLK